MELGYDICLEKPAAVNIEDCIKIRDTANRLGRKVMLTHVMRYSPFYQYMVTGVALFIAVLIQSERRK